MSFKYDFAVSVVIGFLLFLLGPLVFSESIVLTFALAAMGGSLADSVFKHLGAARRMRAQRARYAAQAAFLLTASAATFTLAASAGGVNTIVPSAALAVMIVITFICGAVVETNAQHNTV